MDYDFTVTSINYIVERKHTPNWRKSNIYCETTYVLMMTLDGEAFFHTSDNVEFCTTTNDISIFRPGQKRSGYTIPEHPWHFISINFDLLFNDDSKGNFDKLFFFKQKGNNEIRNKIIEISKLWANNNMLSRMKCKMLLQEILFLLLSEHYYEKLSHTHVKMNEIISFIEKNYTNNITSNKLSEISGLSISYLRKIFHDTFGISPHNYIIDLRIKKAKELLSSGEFNVSETAFLCGFNDVFYFSKMFKRKTGAAPSTYFLRK